MRSKFYPAGFALALVVAMSATAWGQRREGSNWPSPPLGAQQMPVKHEARNADLVQMQEAAERHKAEVQKDTDRLSQLVTELKQELEKTPAGTLSVDAVKRSKEIEKMAKRVRKEVQGD